MATVLTLRSGKDSPLTNNEMDNNLSNIKATIEGIQHTPTIISDEVNNSTGFFGLPVGTTAERPETTDLGMFRFNTDLGVAEYWDGLSWKGIDSPPAILSFTPESFTSADTTVSVTGSNFQTGVNVALIGSSGTEYLPSAVTRISSASLSFSTTSEMVTAADDHYDIKITNPSGLSSIFEDALYIPQSFTWNTASGNIGTAYDTFDVSTQGLASVAGTTTSLESDVTIQYNIVAGSIPSGTSFNNSTGAITGNPTDVSAGSSVTSTFTVRSSLIDASEGTTEISDRSFNIVIAYGYDGSTSARAATSAEELYDLGISSGSRYIKIGSTGYLLPYEAVDKFSNGTYGWVKMTPSFYESNTSLRANGHYWGNDSSVDSGFVSGGFFLGNLTNAISTPEMAWVEYQLPDLTVARINKVTAVGSGGATPDATASWVPNATYSEAKLLLYVYNKQADTTNPSGYPWIVWDGASTSTYSNGKIKFLDTGDIIGSYVGSNTFSAGSFPYATFSAQQNNPKITAWTGDQGDERYDYLNWEVYCH
jgi:hypothetical protein